MIDVEETTFDLFLRYGLFFGAIFQLVCIGAAIFGPEISETHSKVPVQVLIVHFSSKYSAICILKNRRKIVKILVLNMVVQQTQLTNLQGPTIVEKWTRRKEDEN